MSSLRAFVARFIVQVTQSTICPSLATPPNPISCTCYSFSSRSRTFNGKLIPRQKLVVSPLDAEDVSMVVKFCVKHSLSPSVRAGGYGIAGWAVAGDVVVDMSLIKDIDVEPPLPEEENTCRWTRLRDMLPPGSKGKGRASRGHAQILLKAEPGTAGVKRRRNEENETAEELPLAAGDRGLVAPNYDNASHNVSVFLRGPPLPFEAYEPARQPPTNRRRLHSPEPGQQVGEPLTLTPLATRQISSDSAASSGDVSGSDSLSRSLSTGTAMTSPIEATTNVAPSNNAPQMPGIISQNTFTTGSSASVSAVPSAFPSLLGRGDPFSYMSASGPSPQGFSVGPPGPGRSFAIPPNLLAGLPSGPGFSQSMGSAAPPRAVHTHAYVTFGAGARQKEIDMYTAENPLEGISGVTGEQEDHIVPYHVPSAAHPVGSSTMLLSGFGFLSRLYGLSSDNLVEVEMVLADGSIVIVSEEEHPDLWWAIRGAGPAFGIVTRYKAKAYPVPVVFAGNLIYRFHRATAPSLIKHFRDCIKGVPRELYANVLLTAGPANQDSLVVIQMCYLGPKEEGQEYLNAIASWDGERCLLNEVHEKSFLHQQDSVAQVLRGKPGRQWFLRSSLIHSLPDEVIHNTVMQFADTPIGCTWIFELCGGAIADFEDNCLPKEQREATWTIAALHQWDMGIDDPRCITTAEDWMQHVIKPVSVGGPFPVFLGRHEPAERTKASFGKNWDRLAELKKKYDPEGFFRNNFWPLDSEGKPVEPLYNEPQSPLM
ncbi:hypothetical protein EIP86_001909 [Pleurotus ostreatoroseus]|nr:hypothetical protein EIP86_001909 [Pleurotus ostreatoroseus]